MNRRNSVVASHLEQRFGRVERALLRSTRKELVPQHAVVQQADDGLVHAGETAFGKHAIELLAQLLSRLVALLPDAAHGLVDGLLQRPLEAHLGRLREVRVSHVEADLDLQLLLQLLLQSHEQLVLEAPLDDDQVVVAHRGVVTRRRQDDQEGVSQAGDADEVVVAQQLAPTARQAPAHDPEHVVDHLEALQLLEGMDALHGDVDDPELALAEQHALHVDLDVGQGGQPGDLVEEDGGVAQDVADGLQQILHAERLGDVGGRPGAVGLHHVGELRPGREEDDRDVFGVAELELAADTVSVEPRHHDVEQHEVGVLREGELEAAFTVVGDQDLVPLRLQGDTDRAGEVDIVVHDQDAGRIGWHRASSRPGWECPRVLSAQLPETFTR
jgi:hypothetical protein